MAAIHRDVVTEDALRSPAYWRALCPHLHVCDADYMRAHATPPPPHAHRDVAARVRDGLAIDGFAVADAPTLEWAVDVDALADGSRALLAAGWPATAILMYDEAWVLHAQASRLVGEACGTQPCLDIVSFAVGADTLAEGARGFSPHRDRQPDNWTARGYPAPIDGTFAPDGTPKFCTLWLALTRASAANSCLCFVPRWADPGYAGKGDAPGGPDPLARALASRPDAYQAIRAAPLLAGGASLHAHRTIHWGSAPPRAPPVGAPPDVRISLSFTFSDPAFEPPYLAALAGARSPLPFPLHELRAALLCAQAINYSSLAATDPPGWRAVGGAFLAHALSPRDGGQASAAASRGLRAMLRTFRAAAGGFERGFAAEVFAKYAAHVAAATGGATGVLVGAREARPSPPLDGRARAAVQPGEVGCARRSRSRSSSRSSSSSSSSSSDGEDDALAELAAQRQAHRGARALVGRTPDGDNGGSDGDDDELDEALDALLEAQAGGAAYQDDYDLLEPEHTADCARGALRRERTGIATDGRTAPRGGSDAPPSLVERRRTGRAARAGVNKQRGAAVRNRTRWRGWLPLRTLAAVGPRVAVALRTREQK